jgi:hypothetical protein
MERERAAHASGEEMFAGVRTFPLFALLGASLTVVTGEMGAAVVAGFLAVAALAVAAYWRTSSSERAGTTTEVAALVTYWIGAIAGAGALLLAAVIGITMAVLLAAKERLEAFPQAMSREELRATLTSRCSRPSFFHSSRTRPTVRGASGIRARSGSWSCWSADSPSPRSSPSASGESAGAST